MLTGILVFFHVMACFTLILVILLQVGKGHGLSGANFNQSGVQSVFGTRTADVLSKATSVMAIVFMITCISLDFMHTRRSRSLFSGATQTSPADIEKIKQALEKIKAEQAQKAANVDQGGAPLPDAASTVLPPSAGPSTAPDAAPQTPAVPAAPAAADSQSKTGG